MNFKTLGLTAAGLLLGGIIGWIVLTVSTSNEKGSAAENIPAAGGENPVSSDFVPRVGSPAPDFELQSITGDKLKLSDHLGHPVLLNFWATWCGPCRLEMPAIQAKFDENFPSLTVLAINFDEPEEDVRDYAEDLGLTFDILLDPGGEVNEGLFRVRGYPTSILVDSEGIIQVVHIGIMTEGQLDDYLSRVGLVQ